MMVDGTKGDRRVSWSTVPFEYVLLKRNIELTGTNCLVNGVGKIWRAFVGQVLRSTF